MFEQTDSGEKLHCCFSIIAAVMPSCVAFYDADRASVSPEMMLAKPELGHCHFQGLWSKGRGTGEDYKNHPQRDRQGGQCRAGARGGEPLRVGDKRESILTKGRYSHSMVGNQSERKEQDGNVSYGTVGNAGKGSGKT